MDDQADPDHADIVIIGMGPAGEDLGGRLGEANLDVVGVERSLVGGECPYWGCVPSKMAVRAAHLLAEARRVEGMAGQATVVPDWAPVAKRIREDATHHWNDRAAAERFEGKGGRLLRGEGRILGPGRVQVGERELVARRGVVVATGAKQSIPPVSGLAESPYWTNHEALEAEELPSSLVVLGAGPIGLELGQVFARFGVRVTVVESADRLLPAEEPEAGEVLLEAFRDDGIDVRVGVGAEQVAWDGDGFEVTLADGARVDGERLLVATGRGVDIPGVGLPAVGVDPDAKAAPVDDRLRVTPESDPPTWAVGDVVGKGQFTHLALRQAGVVLADILGESLPPLNYRAIPRVTFTDPEVGSVGLSEKAAREKGLAVRVVTTDMAKEARGWMHKAGNAGFVKLVVDADRSLVVGACAAGPSGGEVLGLLTLAVHAEVPIEQLSSMVYAYPTFHRAVEAAIRDLP